LAGCVTPEDLEKTHPQTIECSDSIGCIHCLQDSHCKKIKTALLGVAEKFQDPEHQKLGYTFEYDSIVAEINRDFLTCMESVGEDHMCDNSNPSSPCYDAYLSNNAILVDDDELVAAIVMLPKIDVDPENFKIPSVKHVAVGRNLWRKDRIWPQEGKYVSEEILRCTGSLAGCLRRNEESKPKDDPTYKNWLFTIISVQAAEDFNVNVLWVDPGRRDEYCTTHLENELITTADVVLDSAIRKMLEQDGTPWSRGTIPSSHR
jgi:hypothetical protein